MISTKDKWEDRKFFIRHIDAAQGDWYAHLLAHKGPYAHTIAGSGPGSECCKYFERRWEMWTKAYADYLELYPLASDHGKGMDNETTNVNRGNLEGCQGKDSRPSTLDNWYPR